MEQKNLNLNLLTEGLPLTDVQTLYHEFFYRKDYQWWRDVEPNDVVVDIGACVGFFVCHALDRNAGRIVAVEPSRPHLKTLIRNISLIIIGRNNHWTLMFGFFATATQIST